MDEDEVLSGLMRLPKALLVNAAQGYGVSVFYSWPKALIIEHMAAQVRLPGLRAVIDNAKAMQTVTIPALEGSTVLIQSYDATIKITGVLVDVGMNNRYRVDCAAGHIAFYPKHVYAIHTYGFPGEPERTTIFIDP